MSETCKLKKELLAIVYGGEMFKLYIYGKTVHVESDHKPLEMVFKKSLQNAPPRLQRMLTRLQPFAPEGLLQAWKGTPHC